MKKLALYRGLVYANLIYSRENSAKLVKEQSQTVYAQIDHAKTGDKGRWTLVKLVSHLRNVLMIKKKR